MAITRYSTFDRTVNTIADRNLISNKVDGMTVVVKDAISDPDAGSGKAIYRWDSSDSSWILVSKSGTETLQFATEEIVITNGTATLSQIPVDGAVWSIVVIDDLSVILAELKIEDLSINSNVVSNISTFYNGKTLRLTYAYGSVTLSIQAAIEAAVGTITETTTAISMEGDIISFQDETGTITQLDLSQYAEDTDISAMFEQNGGDIIFKGNLIPESNETLSIGSETNKIKDLYVSANTIHLGEATTFEGTTITVDGGANPTSLSDIPTIVGSSLVAKPFTYNPGTGNITVRPSIAFQDVSGNSYPISFDTVDNKFSFDALGNHGKGSIVAQDLELSGSLDLDGYTFASDKLTIDGALRVDGNITLGYDSDNTISLRATTNVEAPILFKEGATLGDGNDNIIVNAGSANTFVINAGNISIDADGVITGATISADQISGTVADINNDIGVY